MNDKFTIKKPVYKVYGLAKKKTLHKRIADVQQRVTKGKKYLSQEEVQKLIHELEIHQIELEMQNEELRLTQQELVKSNDRFADLYDFAPVGYVTINNKGLILEANLTLTNMLGIEKSLLIKKRLSDYIVPEDQHKYYKYIHNHLNIKGHHSIELRLREKVSGYFWSKFDGATVEGVDVNNRQIRFAISDITSLKLVAKELRENENKLQSLYTAMNEGVCQHEIVYNLAGSVVDYRILNVNPSYETITGLKKDNVIGRLASELYGTGEPPFLDVFAKVASTGESIVFETFFPPLQKHFHVSVFSPEKGKFATVFSDITHYKKIEAELKSSSEKIELFAYSVAHDLKNPADGLHGLTKLLSKKYKDKMPGEGKHLCDQIALSAERISTLAETINIFVAAKETPLSIEKISLKKIFIMIREEFSSQLHERSIKWIEPGNLPETIYADRIAILRVLRNLIDNAFKYAGKNLSRIEIAYTGTGDFHILSVKDDGKGIKNEDAKNIFGAFKRHADVGEIHGTGLGLTIVKELVELHKGEVWVEPNPKGGTIFNISISKYLL